MITENLLLLTAFAIKSYLKSDINCSIGVNSSYILERLAPTTSNLVEVPTIAGLSLISKLLNNSPSVSRSYCLLNSNSSVSL